MAFVLTSTGRKYISDDLTDINDAIDEAFTLPNKPTMSMEEYKSLQEHHKGAAEFHKNYMDLFTEGAKEADKELTPKQNVKMVWHKLACEHHKAVANALAGLVKHHSKRDSK